MTAIALIPARSGSKRISNKNLEYVGRHSLVCRAINTAFETKLFDRVVLSTDAVEIAEHAKSHFNDLTIFMRPAKLAQDTTPMLPVVHHVVEEYAKQFKGPPDDIVLLQPTSPFRTVDDIRSAFDLYKRFSGDAVVSVTEPEEDLVFNIGHASRLRHSPGVVVPNGAIYILWVGALACGQDWYSGVSYAYRMPKERSLDIDTTQDLILARTIENMGHAKVEHTASSQNHSGLTAQASPGWPPRAIYEWWRS